MMLTDLRNIWRYFWLSSGYICYHQCNLHSGVFFLNSILIEFNTSETNVHPMLINASYRTRYGFLEAVSIDHATPVTTTSISGLKGLEESEESEGWRQVLKRPKIDIMSLIPKDDVGDFRDVFDTMTPEEILE